jgi:arginyl-tRNA--protein-N-Asp/Glu arginylyltransferase
MNNPLFSAAARGILGARDLGRFFAVTDQRNTRVPQFFLTPGGPCPYLPGKTERKVFARLGGNLAQPLSEALTHSGFRRSQSIAYRPACEGCNACVSVRIRVGQFQPSRSQKRILRRCGDLVRAEVAAEATREQFALLRGSSSRCCAPIWIPAIPAAA